MTVRMADGRDFSELTMEEKRFFRTLETLVQVNILEFEGALTWVHEGVEHNELGTLRQAILSDLWKEHGHPQAWLWILHADRQGYDYVGPITCSPNGPST